MLDSILNYGRLALLGIAMAFLINPYPLYAEDEPERIWLVPAKGDLDKDGLLNDVDVCIDTKFSDNSHARCLAEAGVVLINYEKTIDEAIKEEQRRLSRGELPQGIDLTVEVLKWLVSWVPFDEPPSTFESAQIKTCANLKTFEEDLLGFGAFLETIATIIGYMKRGAPFPISTILGIVKNVLKIVSREYKGAAFNAGIAHDSLCHPKRLEEDYRRPEGGGGGGGGIKNH